MSTLKTISIIHPSGSTTNLTLDNAGNATLGSKLTIPTTSLSTAAAGLMEYDGKVPYFTPQGTQRGVVPGMQYYELNSTLALASSTSAQAWLGVGCTLSSNTVYAFRGLYVAIKTNTTTSHTVGTGFGGTATLNNIGYYQIAYFSSVNLAAPNEPPRHGYIQTASNYTTMTASTSATSYQFWWYDGIVSVNAGGTFIPQTTISATGPIYTGQVGSYFSIWPIGTAGTNISVGTWA
jgi:hypothetical protein